MTHPNKKVDILDQSCPTCGRLPNGLRREQFPFRVRALRGAVRSLSSAQAVLQELENLLSDRVLEWQERRSK
jgi:hypothetical protein